MSKPPATTASVDTPQPADDDWLTREEVAADIRFSPQTLGNWATQRPPKGPPFVKVCGKARYRRGDVREWKQSHYQE